MILIYKFSELCLRMNASDALGFEKEEFSESSDEFDEIDEINEQIIDEIHEKRTAQHETYNKIKTRHELHLKECKDSKKIYNRFYREDAKRRTKRKQMILEYVKESAKLIWEKNEKFDEHNKKWRDFNQAITETNEVKRLNQYLCEKGADVRYKSSSLYAFLTFESVEQLDVFWREYNDGILLKEIQEVYFSGSSEEKLSTVTVVISEENYKSYRSFLGMYIVHFLHCNSIASSRTINGIRGFEK